MATTELGTRLTDLQFDQQIALRASVLREVMVLWPALDFTNIDAITGTWPAFEAALALLIDVRYANSAQIAAAYFQVFRAVEGVPGSSAAILAGALPDEQILTSIRVTGLYEARKQLAANAPDADRQTLAKLLGSTGNLVAHGGRNTLIGSANADRQAIGYARVASGRRACAFCRMLASRGFVFKESTVGFRAHDGCACTVETQYRTDQSLPSGSAADSALWAEATAGYYGKDAINAFRRAVYGGA